MKTKLKRIVFLTILSLVCFSVIGCSAFDNKDEVTDDAKSIGIRGIVTEITVGNEEGQILIEGEVEDDTMYDKASVHITKDTIIQKDSLSKSFNLSDIKLGDTVEVVFKGPVAESYPVQGTADIVRIITSKQ